MAASVGGQWMKDNGQRGFIPHPATYLNQRRWEDEPAACGDGKNAQHGPHGSATVNR